MLTRTSPLRYVTRGYLQTGTRSLFDQLERTSWHWRDRRRIHMETDIGSSKWEGDGIYTKYMKDGLKSAADMQHPAAVARYAKANMWGYGNRWGPMDTQHFSVDEVVNYYYLTGDRQCLTAINKYAQQAAQFVGKTSGEVAEKGSSRAHGWIGRALVACYEATGDKRWFEAAEQMVKAIAAGQDKTAGSISPIHTAADSKGHTPFMAAAVGMALGRYYKHHQDEEVFDAFMGIADWMCYYVAAGAGGFSYHWSEHDPGKASASGNRCMSTMSWAYTATGQKRYLDAADKHAEGKKIAFWTRNGFGQEYLLNKLTQRADPTPPSAVQDLSAEPLGGGKVRLAWTAPGDDAGEGQAARYQIKYAAKEIKEHSNWRTEEGKTLSFWAATNCKNEPEPSAAGAKESFTAEGLKPGTYWFALKTYDKQPNQSDLSNVVKVEVK
jgi:hypothetical protein